AGAEMTRMFRGLAILVSVFGVVSFADAKPQVLPDLIQVPAETKRVVDVATVDGAIQPISAEYIVRAIDRAEKDHREALVIRLDTPGGLDTSMRQIIKRILISEVPVIVYVSPAGSRAASAGTFIAYAAHVSAMTPGTAIGAATPVNVGGADVQKDLARKVQNDAVSYIRSLATQRGRNADWAEKAVRVGGSLPEDEALKLHVVDFVARDLDELLEKVDGRKVEVAGATRTLHTAGAEHHGVPPSLRQRLLSRIVDPNVAYILFILGFYGLIFELSNPGAILPGIVGGIAILLALLAFQTLPVNMAGVFLILFAMLLFLVEVKVQSHGLLAGGGVIALVLGSLILLTGEQGSMRLSLSVVLTVAVTTVLFFAFVVGAGWRALRRKAVTGHEGLVGERGVALTEFTSREGRIFVHGENWAAEASERIGKGEPVIVDHVDGMRLRVRKA
ncbi:MAG TPA: nodulation protein NfeD, partial [Candidatus Saccharimonadales bacterium]|nr:nodulation protein NfeD [Candidatus Saccharimonadales bacterium]